MVKWAGEKMSDKDIQLPKDYDMDFECLMKNTVKIA
jgi:hypothetical protein